MTGSCRATCLSEDAHLIRNAGWLLKEGNGGFLIDCFICEKGDRMWQKWHKQATVKSKCLSLLPILCPPVLIFFPLTELNYKITDFLKGETFSFCALTASSLPLALPVRQGCCLQPIRVALLTLWLKGRVWLPRQAVLLPAPRAESAKTNTGL